MDSTVAQDKETNYKEFNKSGGLEDCTSKPPAVGYYVFYLLGMATLLPWNFFITHDSYWAYKFRNVTVEDTVVRGPMLINFYSYLSIASMIPNTAFLILNAVCGHRLSQRLRLMSSMIIIALIFTAIVVMVRIDTDDWQQGFLTLTMLKVAVVSAACAVFQGALFDLAARIPGPYVSAVMSGQGLGAVFSNVCYILALSMAGSNPTQMALNSALVFFIIAVVVVIISIACYVWIMKQPYFSENLSDAVTKCSTDAAESNSSSGLKESLQSLLSMLNMIKWQAASVTLVFLVTLAIFPTTTVTIQPTWKPDSRWAQHYFRPVACFLLFNIADFLGRTIAGRFNYPKSEGKLLLLIFSISRLIFVPLFMFCNVQHFHLSTFFYNDIFYVLFMAIFGLSNGYVATLAMMYGPQMVPSELQGRASATMVAFLGIGLSLGAAFSKLVLMLL